MESASPEYMEYMALGGTGNYGFLPFDNALFYDEKLDDDSYDHQLIEDLFSSLVKHKYSKLHAKRMGPPLSRIDT